MMEGNGVGDRDTWQSFGSTGSGDERVIQPRRAGSQARGGARYEQRGGTDRVSRGKSGDTAGVGADTSNCAVPDHASCRSRDRVQRVARSLMARGITRQGVGHDAMIGLPAGTQIWVAAGATNMRKGFDTLCAIVHEQLKEDPFSGQLFVFRGKQGDRVKILWWYDGGLCLFYRRLEEGKFTWPRAASGVVSLSSAQL